MTYSYAILETLEIAQVSSLLSTNIIKCIQLIFRINAYFKIFLTLCPPQFEAKAILAFCHLALWCGAHNKKGIYYHNTIQLVWSTIGVRINLQIPHIFSAIDAKIDIS